MKTKFESRYIPYWQSESISYLISEFIFSETVFWCRTQIPRETYLEYLDKMIEILAEYDAEGLYKSAFYKSAFYKN